MNYRQAQSVYDNKKALKLYSLESNLSHKISSVILQYIRDLIFWMELDELREILQPIDKALRMSEGDKFNLGRVIPQ